MFKHPDEKTASLRIYPQTQSFFDFGRGIGGDSIRLWSHIKGCDNWSAMNEIAALYGISAALNETDKENIVAKIKRQEKAQKEREQAEKRKWIDSKRRRNFTIICSKVHISNHSAIYGVG